MLLNKQSLKSFHIVFIAGEDEYKSEQTLPLIAKDVQRYGARTTVLTSYPDPSNPSDIPGLEALDDADLVVFFIRFRTLPEEQFRHIQDYIERGKPVIGLRTSTHAFRYPEGHPLEPWNTRFGTDVLGAPWIRHYGHTSSTDVFIKPGESRHPILEGIPERFHVRSWLYYVIPYPPKYRSEILLWGNAVNPELEPGETAVVNPVAWTFKHYGFGRTFITTMGHPEDFQIPAFRQLLINAIHWALDVNSGKTDVPKINKHHPSSDQSYLFPLTPVEKMAQTDYDVLIIGSGAGGGAALWRLCEQWGGNNKKIGIIEAGPLLLPTHGRNIPTLNQERFTKYFANPLHTEYIGQFWPEYPGARIVKALGGRTLQWYLMSARLNPADFQSWPISYREIVPYYLIAEEIMNVTTRYAEGSSIQETLLQRLRSRGFPDAMALPLAADLEPTQNRVVHSNVFFSSILLLARAFYKRPFDLAVNTRAIQLQTDKGRAVGVKVIAPDNKSYTITAKTVVLSGGTWETPRLLLYSGIPGNAIGHYLVNHPTIIADAKGNRDQFPEILGVASLLIPNPDSSRSLIAGIGTDPEDFYWYAYENKPLLEELKFRFFALGAIEQQFDNRVYLNPASKDKFGIPRLQVNFSYSNQDRVTISEMFRFIQRAVTSMELVNVNQPRLLAPGEDNHESGTCRMGIDPETSATNPFGQIHGIQGLFVADNSVVRLTGPANPTLTTVALAIRTADYIVHQFK